MASAPEPQTPLEPSALASQETRTGEARTQPSADAGWPAVDRRSGDRRSRPTRFWDALLGWRRRQRGRRREDESRLYVDRYRPADVALTLAVFILNILDAFFTLIWLGRGGEEKNPLMERLIEAGHETFLFEKCILVGFWIVLLTVHKNFPLARIGLWGLLVVYAALFGWHLFLQLLRS